MCVSQRWLQHTIVIILTILSAMSLLLFNEVRCIWCENGRNCCGEKREGQSANNYLLIIILILGYLSLFVLTYKAERKPTQTSRRRFSLQCMTEHNGTSLLPLITYKFKGQVTIVKGTMECCGHNVKSPVGLSCDIAVLLHRVVTEYITLHSQPGSLYRNNSYTHARANLLFW